MLAFVVDNCGDVEIDAIVEAVAALEANEYTVRADGHESARPCACPRVQEPGHLKAMVLSDFMEFDALSDEAKRIIMMAKCANAARVRSRSPRAAQASTVCF